jgi:hypothetical protein
MKKGGLAAAQFERHAGGTSQRAGRTTQPARVTKFHAQSAMCLAIRQLNLSDL